MTIKGEPKDRRLDRHATVQRNFRDAPEELAKQDAVAEAKGLSWTEWIRSLARAATQQKKRGA